MSTTTDLYEPCALHNIHYTPVVLIYPPLPEYAYKIRVQDRESLALGYLTTASQRAGFQVVCINAELEELTVDVIIERLITIKGFQLVGISIGSERGFRVAKELAECLKQSVPGVHITTGGIFPTTAHEQIIRTSNAFDSVIRGEGEAAIAELATRILKDQSLDGMLGVTHRRNGQIIVESERPRALNLDNLGFPDRSDLRYMLKIGQAPRAAKIIASRGCYARCAFCSIHAIFGNKLVARRTPPHVVAEMRQIQEDFGISRFAFMDDLFITPSKHGIHWVKEFCDELKKSDLSVSFWIETRADTVEPKIIQRLISVGLDSIFIGIEFGVDSVLKRLEKDVDCAENERALRVLRESGLRGEDIRIGYIMFEPRMSFEELKKQYDWLKRSGHARVQNLQNKMNVYRNTPIYWTFVTDQAADAQPDDLFIFEFEDPKVRNFERVFRIFHRRCVDELMAPVVETRMLYIEWSNLAGKKVPSWIKDAASQLLRKVEQGEREVYYRFFNWGFQTSDQRDLREDDLISFWAQASNQVELVTKEAKFLKRVVTSVWDLSASDFSDRIEFASFSAQRIGGRAYIAIGNEGVSVELGFLGFDLYDNSCRFIPDDLSPNIQSPMGEFLLHRSEAEDWITGDTCANSPILQFFLGVCKTQDIGTN